jgi:magnesium-protoporphyrin IX monomethyl ester (oxidative) cyclase
MGRLRQAWAAANAAVVFGRLFLLPVKRAPLPKQIRMVPSW